MENYKKKLNILAVDKTSDRFEFIDLRRRLTNNELNAALRNVVEEKKLNLNLTLIKNESKSLIGNRDQKLQNIKKFIENLQVCTGYSDNSFIRKSQSSFDKRSKSSYQGSRSGISSATSSKKKNFMQTLLSSSSATMNQSLGSFDSKHRKEVHGTSMNFNDIIEISDTSDESDCGNEDDEINDESLVVHDSQNLASSHRAKSCHFKLNKNNDINKNVTKIRPLTTTNNLKNKNDNQHEVNSTRNLFECKTAPIERRKNGFKTQIDDDESNTNIAAWLRYKKDKSKREKNGNKDAVFIDEKLERKYYELCAQRDQIPHHTPEEIENLKKRDPIFAKRYKQFLSSKYNGKPAYYDANDLNTKIFMPRWTIEKEKQSILAETRSQAEIIREINSRKQQIYNDRVKTFIKKIK